MGRKGTVNIHLYLFVVIFVMFLVSCKTTKEEPIRSGLPDDFDHIAREDISVKVIDQWKKCIEKATSDISIKENDVYKVSTIAYYECDKYEKLMLNSKLASRSRESAFVELDYLINDMKMYSVRMASKESNIKNAGKEAKRYSACLAEMILYYFKKNIKNKERIYSLAVESCKKEENESRDSLLTMFSEGEAESLIDYAKNLNKKILSDPAYGKNPY
ncbi:hypothetical protein [Desulfolutivibrio sulfoxidireducens]|uniref:hypothetical protein n=1 Tax=Desulfolutivibrio sulfoxidireducens TaxID=2773299 RepID=UPI00159E4EE0|nr:hypothetical protein [Desulfolutivibrio sulfoxidireducens]QLA20603.1 hypothetical protein GD604_13235 [Desulfolutivibrio sulfoxidireducens]